MRSLALVLASGLALAVPSAGCAAIAARAPASDRSLTSEPNCNPGKGGVGVDVVAALLLGLGGIGVAGESPEAGAVFILSGAAYGVSAAVGNSAANKCRAAQEQYAQYQDAGGDQIGGLPVAPPRGPGYAGPGVAVQPQPQPPVAVAPAPAKPPVAPPPQPAKPAAAPTPQPKPAYPDSDSGSDADSGGGGDADDPWSAFWQEVP